MDIEQNIWGFTPEGEAVVLYTLRNASGAEVKLTNIGACIVSITVPDRSGEMADVLLGFDDFNQYFNDPYALGKTVGRYANRIANGIFILDGDEFRLTRNQIPNHLHGGIRNFSSRLWECSVEDDRIVFILASPDGEEGYPGEINAEVVYSWTEKNELVISFFARTDRPTIINMTNHGYFNLRGHNSGDILSHELQLNASRYLPVNSKQIPTGEYADVKGTPMDFTSPRQVGMDMEDNPYLAPTNGYDHCWLLDDWEPGKTEQAANLYDPSSGRSLEIFTDQPGIQVFTGNSLNDLPAGKDGVKYKDHSGIALECQGLPDAPNHPDFPSQILRPGEIYHRTITYRFSVKEKY